MVEDAKWQDGEPVTADDVKFTISSSDHFIAGYYGKGKCCQSFYCNWSDQLDKYRKGNTYRGPTDTKQ